MAMCLLWFNVYSANTNYAITHLFGTEYCLRLRVLVTRYPNQLRALSQLPRLHYLDIEKSLDSLGGVNYRGTRIGQLRPRLDNPSLIIVHDYIT